MISETRQYPFSCIFMPFFFWSTLYFSYVSFVCCRRVVKEQLLSAAVVERVGRSGLQVFLVKRPDTVSIAFLGVLTTYVQYSYR